MNENKEAALKYAKEFSVAMDNLKNNPSFGIVLDYLMDTFVYRQNTELEETLLHQYTDAGQRALLKEGQAQVALALFTGVDTAAADITAIDEVLTNVAS